MGNGNYLGQDFEGVQPCPRCHGKGFLNPDGTPVNAFDGLDSDPVVSCPDCATELAERTAAEGDVRCI